MRRLHLVWFLLISRLIAMDDVLRRPDGDANGSRNLGRGAGMGPGRKGRGYKRLSGGVYRAGEEGAGIEKGLTGGGSAAPPDDANPKQRSCSKVSACCAFPLASSSEKPIHLEEITPVIHTPEL